ncbi:MAG: ABC transporter ATP-binding protein [Thermodesulfobacteriota bacterium]
MFTPMIKSPFKKYLFTLINVMSWRVALTLGLMVCLGLMEGVSLLILVPLLQMVGLDVQQGTLGRIAEFISSLFSVIGIRPTLIVVLCLYVLIVILHSILKRLENSVSLKLQHEFVVRLRLKLYRAIANTNWLFFVRQRLSDFTHALTIEMERIGAATYYILNLLATGIVTIVYILFALKLSATMTGMVFLCGSALVFMLRRKTKTAQETGEGLSEAMSSLYNAVSEHLGGMKIAKSYGSEDRHAEIFGRLTEQVRHMYTYAVQNQAEVNYWFNVGSVIILSIILYVSFKVLSIPTAGVLLLLYLFARIMPKFSSIQQNFHSFINMMPSFNRIMDIQNRCEEAADSKIDGTDKFKLQHSIRFERVFFSYNMGKSPAIIDLNLTINVGETTAIVGPSGAGKSTIADLVMGLINPDQGKVLADGKLLSPEVMKSWREQIGYVPQDTFLFHDTLRANLLWAKPDADEKEIKQSLKFAALEEFILRLPNGLETILGDRGVLISGGERQRLALARALLRKPSLLILDEATSSLDSENEKRIQNAIEKLHGQMTILVISHRLSTIRGADVIHMVEGGRLIESGTWGELITKENGRFRTLCEAQDIELTKKFD